MKPMLSLAFVVLALGTALVPSRADVEGISVTVKGITCPVCTHTINIGLRSLAGVKTVKMSLATRVQVDVTPYPGCWIAPARILQEIALVGFQPRSDELKLRLRGAAAKIGDHWVLTLSDVAPGPVRFLLQPAEQSGSKQGDKIAEAFRELGNAAMANSGGVRRVELEGWWRPAEAEQTLPTLLVTDLVLLPQIENGQP